MTTTGRQHTFYIDRDLYYSAAEVAALRGEDLRDVVPRALLAYKRGPLPTARATGGTRVQRSYFIADADYAALRRRGVVVGRAVSEVLAEYVAEHDPLLS